MFLALLCLASCRHGEEDADSADGSAAPDGGADRPMEVDASNGVPDASARCSESNAATAIAAHDGFVEVCADPATTPGAVCGDGSPYKMSYRRAATASAGLLLYFRGGGTCTDYVSCWGNDGLGGDGRRVATLENTFGTAPNVSPQVGHALGILDTTEVDNPLKGYDVAWISYCAPWRSRNPYSAFRGRRSS